MDIVDSYNLEHFHSLYISLNEDRAYILFKKMMITWIFKGTMQFIVMITMNTVFGYFRLGQAQS